MPRRGADRLDHSAHGFYHPVRDSSGLLPHRNIAAWKRSRALDGAPRTMHLASPVQMRPGEP
ncbi:hypothetical protein EAG_14797 [Camponotus floridanus]|uniref:Uncharacterized protein n=1 Tax=Camponotus floridanus TaxID=104421 RepID=E1ZWQ2_CAMFO|nr:hypothetical protein EAG_14797 [Camponotus floridanus]